VIAKPDRAKAIRGGPTSTPFPILCSMTFILNEVIEFTVI
jgi:hypothetical protein